MVAVSVKFKTDAWQFLDPRLPDRFWSKCVPEPNSGCWLWIGATDHGYGKFNRGVGKPTAWAHRVAYETLVGPFSKGLETDHRCRVRCCCNPAHLEPVTRQVNQLRKSVVRPRCPHGHLFDEANTFRVGGARRCRTCDRQRSHRRRQAVA